MKKFLTTTLALLTMVSTATADVFYQQKEQLWNVYGVVNVKEKNPACIAEQTWRDGSYIQLIKDLADNELYIALTNMEWQIQDEPGNYKMRVNAFVGSEIHGFNFDYTLINKNSIVIRGIIGEKFVPVFAAANKLRFVMPGTITNADIQLNGSRAAIIGLSDCMNKFKSGSFDKLRKGTDL